MAIAHARRRPGRAGLAAAALALAAVLAAPPAHAQAVERGRALYETRCIACHASSVHQRESRRASDFPSLRAEVARWSATAGGEWRDEEIDAVTAYLNDRWYRFPCPETVCRAAARASLAPGLAAAPVVRGPGAPAP